MATQEQIKPLMAVIDTGLTFKEKNLINRSEWGSITFEKASQDLTRIFDIIGHLKSLPLEYLTDGAVTQIQQQVTAVNSHLQQVDSFSITSANNPSGTRDSLMTSVHTVTDQLYGVTATWIPFLAYQKGDVAKNITALNNAVGDAKQLLEDAKTDVANRKKDVDGIVEKAREASASAGAAVFTQAFDSEATKQTESAGRWLKATAAFATLTMIVAGLLWFFTDKGLDYGELIQKFGTKLAILAILFTATVWCGRTYRALMHQSAMNRHRALSLQSFQAFLAAAADPGTKDAVLLETTRAIFTAGATGYLDGHASGQDSDIRVIDVAKGVGAAAKAAQH